MSQRNGFWDLTFLTMSPLIFKVFSNSGCRLLRYRPHSYYICSSSDFDPQALCDTLIRFSDKEEIHATLFTMHPLKSLGLDGF